jgi:hypothetical protein
MSKQEIFAMIVGSSFFPKSVHVTCQPFYAPAMHSAAGNRKAKSPLAL